MGLAVGKPVFGVSDKVRLQPVSSAIETSWKIEISLVARLYMVLSKKRITKVLIRLCKCTGWSAPVLFANRRRQVFSRRGPNNFVYPYLTIREVLECKLIYSKTCVKRPLKNGQNKL